MIDYRYGVTLGPLKDHNMDKYMDLRNDYRIWKWCRQNDLLQMGVHAAWYASVTADTTHRKMYEVLNTRCELVGICGLTDIDMTNRRAEFSLYIAPAHQRKGYARGALQTLFTHGFMNLGLNSIWGETFDGNPALELFKSLGMVYEGTRLQFYYRDGDFIDAHLISLCRRDFDHIEKDWLKKPLQTVK
jgi:diamine N-acetyltransferase